jgi:energy-coupling factor transporter ATP-binding protein EcfA2
MQLERARIKNFRSLRDIEVTFGAHTALIGGNGAGKSSILKAIEKFYSTSKNCDADDFFGRDQGQPIEIELTFHQLSNQEAAAFEDRVRDGKLVVTRIFDGGSSSGRYHGVVPQIPEFVAVRTQPSATQKRTAYNFLRENNPLFADLPSAGSAAAVDQALLDWEANHHDQLVLLPDDGQFFGFQNNSRGKLQRHTTFVFIPAVREASADAADGKGSVIGKLLDLLVRSQILQRDDVQAFKAQMTGAYQALVSADNMPNLEPLLEHLLPICVACIRMPKFHCTGARSAKFRFPCRWRMYSSKTMVSVVLLIGRAMDSNALSSLRCCNISLERRFLRLMKHLSMSTLM